MISLVKYIIIIYLIIPVADGMAQHQQAEVDSLVNLLKGAHREWNDYAIPLIAIGEPAVPALIKVARDKSLSGWTRRISIMTLNDIHSPLWVEPAWAILMDRSEDPTTRNQVTNGLRGFDLSDNKQDLWQLYEEAGNEFHRSNLAHLMLMADTSMAYTAFVELYSETNGWVQRGALINLVKIRPWESGRWFLNALQVDDWMTANLAMDSLVVSYHFRYRDLVDLYHLPDIPEEVRWRIVYIFGQRGEPELVPLLIVAFQDESWLVHTEAMVALGRLEPEQVVMYIEPFRKDSRDWARNNARWVIRAAEDK